MVENHTKGVFHFAAALTGLSGGGTVRQLPKIEKLASHKWDTREAVKFSHACKLLEIVPTLAPLKCMLHHPRSL